MLMKSYSHALPARGIVALVGLMLILGLTFTPASASSAPLVTQELVRPEAPDIQSVTSEETSMSNDSRIQEFLDIDWQTEIPDLLTIQASNSSILEQSDFEYEIAPMIPLKSMPKGLNKTLVPRQDAESETSTESSDYFPGHTWGSSFGPDDTDVEAYPVTPALEGHWFPKEGYARIYYYAFLQPNMKLHLRVERDQDTYSRYFRVYFGSTQVLQKVVSTSWEGDINIGSFGWYIITLEIYYGGYKEKGWQLRYYHLSDSDGDPYDTDMQIFRKKSYSELVYKVPMGPHTILNIQTQNYNDPYDRFLYVYVDGSLAKTLYAPGSYEVQIANFANPGMHEIKFVLYYGGWVLHPKGLKHFWINYEYKHVEVDWMEGWFGETYYDHSQPQAVFDFVEAYYIIHDYRRVEFHPHESVGFEYYIDWVDFEIDYYLEEFDHIDLSHWDYGLFAHYGEKHGQAALNYGFYIGDQSSDTLDVQKYVLLHEFGHVEAMIDDHGGTYDVYGTADPPLYSHPFYCAYSWELEHLAWVRGWW